MRGNTVSGRRQPNACDAQLGKVLSLVHELVVPALLPGLPVESLPAHHQAFASLSHAQTGLGEARNKLPGLGGGCTA